MKDEAIAMLAAKLGVAVDVLWAALLRQAPIAGAVDLLFLVAIAIATFAAYRWGKSIIPKIGNDIDEAAWIGVAIVVFAIGFLWLAVISQFGVTLAAFFNPEYWALYKVLSFVK